MTSVLLRTGTIGAAALLLSACYTAGEQRLGYELTRMGLTPSKERCVADEIEDQIDNDMAYIDLVRYAQTLPPQQGDQAVLDTLAQSSIPGVAAAVRRAERDCYYGVFY